MQKSLDKNRTFGVLNISKKPFIGAVFNDYKKFVILIEIFCFQ